MDADFIEDLIGIMRRHGLAELDYAEGETRIRLKAPEGGEAPAAAPRAVPAANPTPEQAAGEAGSGANELRAGMQGVFYRAPEPGAEPFVTEGAQVSEGDTLALLEAMKMLTPVEAERGGRVVTIHVENGQSVARGDLLFTLEAE